METINKYTKQANDFLAKHGILYASEFIKSGIHFDGDKEERDVYNCTLKRGAKTLSIEFGQSINNSGFYCMVGKKRYDIDRSKLLFSKQNLISHCKMLTGYTFIETVKSDIIHIPEAPTAYDLLTCITKNDPIDFESFCSEYGYSNDSISAKKTFKSVNAEYTKVIKFFSEVEIEELQEIQ